jgi:shikimate dehydrogenase
MRTRAAVLGKPISHSLSPILHNAAYEALGLAMTYDRVEVGEGELSGFVASCDDSWAGLSLTMPLKVEALEIADECDSLAKLSGAANTLIFSDTAGISAHNTDIYGLTTAIGQEIGSGFATAAILGSGATARSALIALVQLETEKVFCVARNLAAQNELRELAHRLEIDLVALPLDDPSWGTCDLVVSTLPGPAAANLDLRDLEITAPLFDVAYSPWPSHLASVWRAKGAAVTSGHLMLLHQACKQVELMTGRVAPVQQMQVALERAL